MSSGIPFTCLALAALLGPAAARADAAGDAVAAGVPAALAREVAARAVERGASPAAVLGPVAEAARRGLPPDLVAAKVLEGLAKGVPPERVAAVASALAGRLADADALLAAGRARGLALPRDRGASLADLATALGSGVQRPAVEQLVAAALAARTGSEAVVSAALTLGELARRGVPSAESLPLGLTVARKGPRPPGEIPALFDAWRAEGGKDPRLFLGEVARRVSAGRSLEGLVDVFGESPDRLVRDRGSQVDQRSSAVPGADPGKMGAENGLGPADRLDAAGGAVPGLEDSVRARARGGAPAPPVPPARR